MADINSNPPEGNAKRLEIEAIRAAMNDYRAVPKPTSDYITWVTMLLARLDEAEQLLREGASPGVIRERWRPKIERFLDGNNRA